MKATLILCLVLLVGVVSGSPADKKKFQHALRSPWSRAVMRAYHYQDPDAAPLCCDKPPYLPGGTPYNGLYGEAPPERGTFSDWRYIKG